MKETEQTKLLYETLNQASLFKSNQFNQRHIKDIYPLEPRRSNPLDRYQSPQDQWQIPGSKPISLDYHGSPVEDLYHQSYSENQGENETKADESHKNGSTSNDDESVEQYLQVDPRCYVRQNSNNLVTTQRRSETPRLEKGYTINIDTRPSGTYCLSPYRQSSFDVTLAYQPPNTTPQPSSLTSTQQDIYFTPRGSSLSIVANSSTNTPPGSQHLSLPTSMINKKHIPQEKKDVTVELNPSDRTSLIRSTINTREHEHSRSLEHSTSTNSSPIDKQSHSFDATNLLRPVINRTDGVINRRTKSYEYDQEHHSYSSVAPPPIIIKIPDMTELVQAAQLSHLNQFKHEINRKNSAKQFWRLHHSYEINEEQQQQFDHTSPDEFSPDFLTSTSLDSAGGMPIIHSTTKSHNPGGGDDDDLSPSAYHRKNSSNLLLPPPEVRRQALRRTFEKRRNCINQSNARREARELSNNTNNERSFDDDNNNNLSLTMKSNDFSSLLNNFNSKSENSSFDRSLETDFDMQSDTSSRGPNDHFTSIESSGNEYNLSDINHRLFVNPPPPSTQQNSPNHKLLESPLHNLSLDSISNDGAETVIYNQPTNHNRISSKIIHSNEQTLIRSNPSINSNSKKISQRSLSTNIPLDDHQKRNSTNIYLSPNMNFLNSTTRTVSSTFHRSASKKRKEFSKDKRHLTTTTEPYQDNQKQTLMITNQDLKRSLSDQQDTSHEQSLSHSNQSDNNTHLSSSADTVIHSTPSSNTNRSPMNDHSRHIFQKCPSVCVSSPVESFRSKRCSMSFDIPTPIKINTVQLNARKSPTINPVIYPTGTKPRLKFSMVRDTTASSLTGGSSANCMSLLDDYKIDEKTNRIINEFLSQDNNDHLNKQSPINSPKKFRQNTFDETITTNKTTTQKQLRSAFIKQRPHSFVQTNISEHFFTEDIQQDKRKIDLTSPSSTLIQQSVSILRRDNGLIIGSPSIIVTGYDSGS